MKTKRLSLKKRIFIFFFGILTLMVCTYIFVISRFITRFTIERLNNDYESILTEMCDTVSNILWNLTLTSEQLLSDEIIQSSLVNHHESPDRYSQQEEYFTLLEQVYSLTMANTELGLICFYDVEKDNFVYSTLPVNTASQNSATLYKNSDFQFQGPCDSQSSFIGNPVLILSRTEIMSNGAAITLSLESGYYSLDKPFQMASQKSAFFIFSNEEGNIIYSTLPDDTDAETLLNQMHNNTDHNYKLFERSTPQGWTAHVIVPTSIYTSDYNAALHEFFICTVMIIAFVAIFTLFFWRSIYHPLGLFDNQLSKLISGDFSEQQVYSDIPEYDYLLHKITLLQRQIQEMLQQAVKQEQIHSQMQLEKLRAQINPHFLVNTLNTLHWMALMNHQPEIDRVTQSLSHLLSYNLAKQSYETNLNRELVALKEYVTLQQIRYSFHFTIDSQIAVEGLNYPCPKFILQPLIENSLTHGYCENMDITVGIHIEEKIKIIVTDTGTGIEEQTLQELQRLAPSPINGSDVNSKKCIQWGIGLPYVVQSLNDFFDNDYCFCIDSRLNEGTTITLELPKIKGGGYDAKNTDN